MCTVYYQKYKHLSEGAELFVCFFFNRDGDVYFFNVTHTHYAPGFIMGVMLGIRMAKWCSRGCFYFLSVQYWQYKCYFYCSWVSNISTRAQGGLRKDLVPHFDRSCQSRCCFSEICHPETFQQFQLFVSCHSQSASWPAGSTFITIFKHYTHVIFIT